MFPKRLLVKLIPPILRQTPQAPEVKEALEPTMLTTSVGEHGTHTLVAPGLVTTHRTVPVRLSKEMIDVLTGQDADCRYEYSVGRNPNGSGYAVLVHSKELVQLERSYVLLADSSRAEMEAFRERIQIADGWIRFIARYGIIQ